MTTATTLLKRLQARNIDVWVDGDRLRCKAPSGALTPALRREIGDVREDLVAMLRATQIKVAPAAPQRLVDRTQDFPLSFTQERLWFLQEIDPDGIAYHVPTVLRLEGDLAASKLQASLSHIVARHEILRTSYRLGEQGPVQRVQPPEPCALPIVDLSGLPEVDRRRETTRHTEAEATRPFDLKDGRVMRALLIREASQRHVLSLCMHHIVTDARSAEVFMHELTQTYTALANGEEPHLPPLSLQYADFSVWQRTRLQESAVADQLAYWRRHLAGLTPLSISTDFPRPAVQRNAGARAGVTVSRSLLDALHALAKREHVTLYVVLVAAFYVLLARLADRWDVAIGTPEEGRTHPDLYPLLGCFVNTLVLRVQSSPEASFVDLLQQVQSTVGAARSHGEVPFERVVQALEIPPDLSRSPVFQVMFSYLGARLERETGQAAERLAQLEVSMLNAHEPTAKFDLELEVVETAQGLAAVVEYDTDLYTASTARRLLADYEALLAALAADAGRPLAALPLAPVPLAAWNATEQAYPLTRTAAGLVAEQAAARPDAV
ncbi:MAG: condensation domain-containing protein, partial [Bacteroidota bacterium]